MAVIVVSTVGPNKSGVKSYKIYTFFWHLARRPEVFFSQSGVIFAKSVYPWSVWGEILKHILIGN
jgi:hypothetical protein